MKLKAALSLLSQTELKELGRLLDAEFFGNQASIAACFHACVALMGHNPDWNEADLSRSLFPDKDPTDYIKYLRTRTSALLRSLEAYLAWTSFRQDPVLQATCLASALHRRGWESGYRQAYTAAMDLIDQAPLRGFGHFAAKVDLVEGIVDFAANEPDKSITGRIQEGLLALDNSFYIRKLSLACKAVSLDRELQVSYRLGAIPSYQAWLADGFEPKEPLVHLYFLLFKITSDISEASDQAYFQARDLLLRHAPAMVASNWSEANDALRHLINYCTRRFNQKAEAFQSELSTLYRSSISTGILLHGKKIDALDFINAFKVFIFANDPEAANWLIQNYGACIRGDAAMATRHFCSGYQKLVLGQYESAGELFTNALNAPPKSKWPPFEAELLAQLARAKFCLTDYVDAIHDARQLLRKIAEKQYLDRLKAKSFKTYCTYLIELCRILRRNPDDLQQKLSTIKTNIENESTTFFGSQWMTKQIESTRK